MFQGDPTDPRSVLDPANYQLVGDTAGSITITRVAYDPASRTAILSFDAIEPAATPSRSAPRSRAPTASAWPRPTPAHFQAISDFSSQVNIRFYSGRANAASKTYSYNVTVTNNGPTPLLAPFDLTFDGLQPINAQVVGATGPTADGSWWLDLEQPHARRQAHRGPDVDHDDRHVHQPVGPEARRSRAACWRCRRPTPTRSSTAPPVTTATAGQPYQFQVAAHDPNQYAWAICSTAGRRG